MLMLGLIYFSFNVNPITFEYMEMYVVWNKGNNIYTKYKIEQQCWYYISYCFVPKALKQQQSLCSGHADILLVKFGNSISAVFSMISQLSLCT